MRDESGQPDGEVHDGVQEEEAQLTRDGAVAGAHGVVERVGGGRAVGDAPAVRLRVVGAVAGTLFGAIVVRSGMCVLWWRAAQEFDQSLLLGAAHSAGSTTGNAAAIVATR